MKGPKNLFQDYEKSSKCGHKRGIVRVLFTWKYEGTGLKKREGLLPCLAKYTTLSLVTYRSVIQKIQDWQAFSQDLNLCSNLNHEHRRDSNILITGLGVLTVTLTLKIAQCSSWTTMPSLVTKGWVVQKKSSGQNPDTWAGRYADTAMPIPQPNT